MRILCKLSLIVTAIILMGGADAVAQTGIKSSRLRSRVVIRSYGLSVGGLGGFVNRHRNAYGGFTNPYSNIYGGFANPYVGRNGGVYGRSRPRPRRETLPGSYYGGEGAFVPGPVIMRDREDWFEETRSGDSEPEVALPVSASSSSLLGNIGERYRYRGRLSAASYPAHSPTYEAERAYVSGQDGGVDLAPVGDERAVGNSRDRILEQFGTPKASMVVGNQEVLIFDTATFVIQNGVVIEERARE